MSQMLPFTSACFWYFLVTIHICKAFPYVPTEKARVALKGSKYIAKKSTFSWKYFLFALISYDSHRWTINPSKRETLMEQMLSSILYFNNSVVIIPLMRSKKHHAISEFPMPPVANKILFIYLTEILFYFISNFFLDWHFHE